MGRRGSVLIVYRLLRQVIGEITRDDFDPIFFVIVGLTTLLYGYHLGWGLPNDNFSWAADALGPLSVLSIAQRSLGKINSGWFWYKYPFGYPALLLLVYAPYLGWLVITGQLRDPSRIYPYGFADPEAALYALGILGRCVSLLLIVGTMVVTYAIGRRLLDKTTARLAAWFIGTAYPMVYYAHTTNQDAAYVFWLTLAIWATIASAQEHDKRWPFVLLGIAAGMAMATKEQGFALLLVLPPLLASVLYRVQADSLAVAMRLWRSTWNRGTRSALLASVVTFAVASNAIINPQGVINRVLDLTGHPTKGMSSRLTPLKFSLFKGIDKEIWYVGQLGDAVESTFGWPLAIVGLAGLAYLLVRRRRAALFLLVPALAYYFISLRTHDLLMLRYALPLFPILALAAAAACTALLARARQVGFAVVALLCLLGLARAVELDLLLSGDSRYRAEAWMAAHVAAGSSIEIYQKPVYLPRFPGYEVDRIGLEERTVAGVAERKPDLIVLSSASRKGITHYWNPDWTSGGLMLERPAARELLDALEAGQLDYQLAAEISQQPWLLRLRITSLCPRIRIYQRKPGST